jgi:hypothetical protein
MWDAPCSACHGQPEKIVKNEMAIRGLSKKEGLDAIEPLT